MQGFIGSHLCRALLEDDRTVVALDDLSSGRRRNVDALRDDPSFTLVRGDVLDGIYEGMAEIDVAPSDVDRIYHLASRASPTDFGEHPLEVALANTDGTRGVLAFADDVEARVVFSSTSEVYGDPERHPQDEGYNGNVDPQGSRACYKEAKRFGETLTSIYRRQRDVDVRVARIFNTYGPRMRPDDGRVVPTFLSQALDDKPLTVHGDGSQTRSFLYVDDLVLGLRALMAHEEHDGTPVNVGSTDEVTIRRLAETVIEIVGADSHIRYEERPDGDADRRCPDITRARRVLDWEPTIGLREGIRRILRHDDRAP